MLRLQLPTCNPPTLQHTHAHTHTHTHRMEVVCTFNLPAKVAAVAMSHLATSHCLIAAGCHDPHLRLCDPASGAFTHTLVGHRYGTDSLCVVCHAHSRYESCKLKAGSLDEAMVVARCPGEQNGDFSVLIYSRIKVQSYVLLRSSLKRRTIAKTQFFCNWQNQ